MIRSKTTLIVGAGANAEIELPDGPEFLNRVAQGFDFARLGTDLQTRDMVLLNKHFEALSQSVNTTADDLRKAAQKIRTAAPLATSINAILEQFGNDPQVLAAGKLAIAHFTLQAEHAAPMTREAMNPGELPLRGSQNWLFQLSALVTASVPRRFAENCFDNLSIVSFNYDRSVQHYLPFALEAAFGLSLEDARKLVAERLDIVQPYGTPGSLPWDPEDNAHADWGQDKPENLAQLATGLRTASECRRDKEFVGDLSKRLAQSERICFLGVDFDPQDMDLLLGEPLGGDAEIIVATTGASEAKRDATTRLLRKRTGIDDAGRILSLDMRCFQFFREYSSLLAS